MSAPRLGISQRTGWTGWTWATTVCIDGFRNEVLGQETTSFWVGGFSSKMREDTKFQAVHPWFVFFTFCSQSHWPTWQGVRKQLVTSVCWQHQETSPTMNHAASEARASFQGVLRGPWRGGGVMCRQSSGLASAGCVSRWPWSKSFDWN